MTSRKVAVVTGSNKGIGYAIVQGLCEKFDGDVYLTSRDEKRGQAAVEYLKTLGYNPLFHQLDVTDQKSVDTFRDYVAAKYGGIDVLVNNAAIAFKSTSEEPISIIARETIDTNYYGTLRLCEALFPLLRQNGRVVNVSSSAGHLSQIKDDDLKAKFSDKNITVDEVNKLMETFVQDAADGKEERWASLYVAYVVSKVGLSCVTQIQQKIFDAEKPNRNISVNSVHPGLIDTDMATEFVQKFPAGAESIEQGARAPLFLALEATFKGKYVWKDCSSIEWDAPSLAEPY